MGQTPAKGIMTWVDDPDDRQPTFVQVIYAQPGVMAYGISLDQQVTGVITHYYGRATHPCTGQGGYCEGCAGKLQQRWKGYLGVLVPQLGRLAILEITKEAYRQCPTFRELKGRLRGWEVVCERAGRAKNAICRADVRWPNQQVPLPPTFNVREALATLWGYRLDLIENDVPYPHDAVNGRQKG